VINPAAAGAIGPRKAARSPEELFPLIDLCRAGKLKEVGEWIAAGKPLDPPTPLNSRRSRRQSPLEIAIEKGFFALAELLLDGGCDPMASGNALGDAVRCEQIEIAKLLLDRGVPLDSIHLSDVFDAGRPMVELFIEHGADPSAGLAGYEALCSKVHPNLFLVKEYGARFPDLQRQAEMALCYHCEKGSARNVGLLLWAGARPDAQVPDPNFIDGESASCAIAVAVRQARIDLLKQMKPQNYPEILKGLISEVWLSPSPALIDYLVGVGAPVNTKENGGCDVIEHLLWSLSFDARGGVFGYPNPAKVSDSLTTIEHLCRAGAKWIPDSDETPRRIRDRFRKIPPQQLLDVFRIFKETNAASLELLETVLDSPALRKSLGSHLQLIDELLHPKRPQKTADEIGGPVKPKEEPPTPAKIRSHAKELLLDVVRQEPGLHFRKMAVCSSHEGKALKRRLGMPKDDDRDIQPLVAAACEELNEKLRSFRTSVEWWGRSGCRLTATLNGHAEWSEALQEAWGFAATVNEALLTDVALRLRALLLSGELGTDWNTEKSITWKIGLYGRERVLEPYLHELENKMTFGLKWERDGARWSDPLRYRFHLGDSIESPSKAPNAVNPQFDVRLADFRRTDQDTVKQLLYREVLKAQPTGAESFFLLSIASRAELANCFRKPPSSSEAANFFANLPLDEQLNRHYDFREGARFWFFAVTPKSNWENALSAIHIELSRPGLDVQYGISVEAAKLLSWIKGLPANQFTGPWTPIVEDARERWIGISCPWSEENFPAYLQLLIEEINDRTDYNLTLQPWSQHGQRKSRIKVGRKSSELDEVIKHVQRWALDKGSVVATEQIRLQLEGLLRPKASDR